MARYQHHALQSGEAQLSTQAKDRKMAELDDWVSDLRAVCEVAFYDRREELERLGPLAPIRRRRQARKPARVPVPALSPMPVPAPSV